MTQASDRQEEPRTMTSGAFARQPPVEIPRPEVGMPGKVSMTVLTILGIGALAGGVALVLKPDGSVMGFETPILEGSPFSDFLIPGLILGGLFGIGSFVAVLFGLRHHRLAPFLAFAIGVGQMIWIAIELAIIKEVSILHPICFGLGAIIALSAVPWGWPTFDAWRRTIRNG
jgi:hypothetical protein